MDNNFNKLLAFLKKNTEYLRVKDQQKLKIFASELNRYVQSQILTKEQTNFELYFGKETVQEYEQEIISSILELLMAWVMTDP